MVALSDVSAPAALRLIDIASGKELSRLSLDITVGSSSDARPLLTAGYGGSWVGDLLVAETAVGPAVFSIARDEIRLVKVFAFPPRFFPMSIHEPQLSDDGRIMTAWAPLPARGVPANDRVYVYVSCEISTMECTKGPPQEVKAMYAVYNPSRSR